MVRTQVYLTEDQDRGLKRMAATSGKKQSELIRAAIEEYLAERRPKDWREALEACFGMWADRDDLDDFVPNLRREADQRLERVWRRRC